MELSELRDAVREELDDTVSPYKRDDARLDRALNNAVREACLRTRRLQDDTSTICTVALVADQATYSLNDTILVVRAVHVDGRTQALVRTTAERLDLLHPGWSHVSTTSGVPAYVVFDVGQKTLRVYPTPGQTEEDAAAKLHLRVWRLPLESERMEGGGDEPALSLTNPEDLKLWACAELLGGKDAELADPARAAEYESRFAAKFGPRPSEHDLKVWSTSPPVGIRMSSEY
jgi:hypothetical protein